MCDCAARAGFPHTPCAPRAVSIAGRRRAVYPGRNPGHGSALGQSSQESETTAGIVEPHRHSSQGARGGRPDNLETGAETGRAPGGGSQGLDALDRFMLGSVSTELIQYATCPVLVVKKEAAPLRRITLAIDGSDASAQALAFVLAKVQPDHSTGKGGRVPIQVAVIHVMPFLKYPELKEAGRRLVEQSAQKLIQAGFTAEAVCQLGKPAEEIMKVASKHRADLIVMGAKGMGAIARFFWAASRQEWSSTVPARSSS